MATLNNFVQGTIEDFLITKLKTALDGVTHPGGGTGSFVVASYPATWEEFIKTQSGLQVCWLHLRNANDSPLSNVQFLRRLDYRVRVATPYSNRQEVSDATAKAYIYLLRKAVIEMMGTYRDLNGNAIDSYIRDEQDYTLSDPPMGGFELTITAETYYWIT